jgi:hypothetical protein
MPSRRERYKLAKRARRIRRHTPGERARLAEAREESKARSAFKLKVRLELVSILGRQVTVGKNYVDNDTRFGMLAYGFEPLGEV